MEKINKFRIEYFGSPYLKDFEVEFYSKNQILSVPSDLNFNSAWQIIHECTICSNEVKFVESGKQNERNYKTLKNIDSKSRKYEFLAEVCKIFPNLEIVKLDNVNYVNRTDFNYEYDMQRKSSVELKHYCCDFCNSDYLSIIRIGYPLEREKGNLAMTGKINVVQITQVMNGHILTEEPKK
jgi:hypothetical protein